MNAAAATKPKVKAAPKAAAPVAPPKPNGTRAAEAVVDPKVAELKAQLEALGYQVKEKKGRQTVNADMVAALTDVVAKFGGVDDPSTKASFIKARKTLWPIDEATRARNKAAAAKRKAKEAAEADN